MDKPAPAALDSVVSAAVDPAVDSALDSAATSAATPAALDPFSGVLAEPHAKRPRHDDDNDNDDAAGPGLAEAVVGDALLLLLAPTTAATTAATPPEPEPEPVPEPEPELEPEPMTEPEPVAAPTDPAASRAASGGRRPVYSPYCVCRRLKAEVMIECSVCSDWFHVDCVGLDPADVPRIDRYHCPACAVAHGPLTWRSNVRQSARTQRRRDYAALDGGTVLDDSKYRLLLNERQFPTAAFPTVAGADLTVQYLRTHGFLEPLLVSDPVGLGMTMPPSSFSVDDVLQSVGPDREVLVIEVATQHEKEAWNMRQFAYYFKHVATRKRIYNVISLEFSDTPLAAQVTRPALVEALDWVTLAWPAGTSRSSEAFPKVQLYCLMSVQHSYTDFHIDFGGSSVFYHIISGAKVFYFVPPTPQNLARYEAWSTSPDQSETFFGDLAGPCLQCHLHAGQTLFIPSGWIHAVYTPVDSIVIGGNFIHGFSVPMQLAIDRIEDATQVPRRFRFPFYRHVHWYYARYVFDQLSKPDGSVRVSELSRWELDSLFALVQHLTEMLQPNWRREVHASWSTNAPFERSVSAALVRDLAALLPPPPPRDQPPVLPPLPAKYHTAVPYVALPTTA